MAAKRTKAAAKTATSKGKKVRSSPALSDEELADEVRRLVHAASGLSAAELKKRLPKPQATAGLAIADDLCASGELFRYAKANKAHFFTEDPIATLERRVPELLRGKALSLVELGTELDATPGMSQVLPEWLKSAIARRYIFEHVAKPNGAAKAAKGAKTYSLRPDLGALLKKSRAALTAELAATDAANVSRQEVLDFLAAELGVAAQARSPSPTKPADGSILREPFLAALRRLADKNGKGALLSVRQLRREARLDKQVFDMTALALSREGAIVLHHHDHAASLSELERSQLIRDDSGTHYVGVALRRPS